MKKQITINEFMEDRNIQIMAFDTDEETGLCAPSGLLCLECGAEYSVGSRGGGWRCPNGCHDEKEEKAAS